MSSLLLQHMMHLITLTVHGVICVSLSKADTWTVVDMLHY